MLSITGHGGKWPLPLGETAVQRPRSHVNKAVVTVSSIVTIWLLFNYVVDVRVTISWRKAALHQQQQNSTRVTHIHCKNTCFKARDGVCDEGRPHRHPAKQHHQQQQQAAQGMPDGVSAVHCDLGTDCSDCGPWTGRQADISWSRSQLPIAFLRSHNIQVRSRATSSASQPLNLSIAFSDPVLDWDVSKYIQKEGVLEVGISQVFYTLLTGRCGAAGGRRAGGLVVDVGANFGWYSLLAAKLGCRVVAWEPVPHFLALLSHNLARNHLSHRVQVRPTVVAHPAGSKQVVVIPGRGIWGSAGIAGLNIDTAAAGSDGLQQVEVVSESLDDVLAGRHVDLLKVDVEGYEPSVLATAAGLLSAGSCDNIILEYSPGVYERANRWSELWVFPKMLLDLSTAGFSLMHLPEDFTRVWSDGRSITAALPQFKQILPQSLRYDFWDVQVSHAGYLDPAKAPHPFCQPLIDLHFDNQGVPERLHPKSFHSVFMHNTNVWASSDIEVYKPLLGGPVGLFPLTTSINSSWFPPSGVVEGLGGIACAELVEDMMRQMGLQQNSNNSGGSSSSNGSSTSSSGSRLPGDEVNALMTILIGRRCRCPHRLPCQKHEAAAEACATAGQTPYVDLDDDG